MVYFELKKIVKSKINRIAMIFGLLLLVVVYVGQNFGSGVIYCEETDSELSGIAAIHYAKEKASMQGDYLTEEMIEQCLDKLRKYEGDLNDEEAYMNVIRKDGTLIYYLASCYMELTDVNFDFNRLKDPNFASGKGFYERRIDKINNYLNMDFSYGNYTKKEKEYWIEKANNVKEPYAWGSKVVVTRMRDAISVVFFLLVVVIICISPVFSKECDTGAAQLLLSTKYGKTSMVRAKIIASMVFTLGYIITCSLIITLLEGATCGFQELKLPVQLCENAIPYSMNMGQSILLNVGIILCISITLVAIMLFVSAYSKNTIATLAFTLVILFLPEFIPYSKSNGVWNHILDLCFVQFANVFNVMERFVDYQFGNVILNHFTMAILVWLALSIILFVPIRRIFVKRIVH